MCYKNRLFDKNVIDKNESYILFYTFPTYQVGMTNVFQTQGYLSISLGWRFETFWRFFSQKTKSFQKIITFTIFMKNGGSTVASKNQALNSDWAKKLTKKDTNLIFFQWKLRCCFFQFWCRVDTWVDTWTSILLWNYVSILWKIVKMQNFKVK